MCHETEKAARERERGANKWPYTSWWLSLRFTSSLTRDSTFVSERSNGRWVSVSEFCTERWAFNPWRKNLLVIDCRLIRGLIVQTWIIFSFWALLMVLPPFGVSIFCSGCSSQSHRRCTYTQTNQIQGISRKVFSCSYCVFLLKSIYFYFLTVNSKTGCEAPGFFFFGGGCGGDVFRVSVYFLYEFLQVKWVLVSPLSHIGLLVRYKLMGDIITENACFLLLHILQICHSVWTSFPPSMVTVAIWMS